MEEELTPAEAYNLYRQEKALGDDISALARIHAARRLREVYATIDAARARTPVLEAVR